MRRVLRAVVGLPPDTTVFIDGRVTIGRAPDSDLQLGDPEVSRRHAKIEVDASGVATLVDLVSTTGTFVGDTRVERHALTPGDEIVIGRFRVCYDEVADQVAERRPMPKRNMEVLRQTTRIELGAGAMGSQRREPPPLRAASVAGATLGGVARSVDVDARPVRTRRDDTARIIVPVVPQLASKVMPRAARGSIEFGDAPVLAGIPEPIDDHAEILPDVPERTMPEDDTDPLAVRSAAMARVRAVFDYRWLRLQQLHHEILDHDELARLEELEREFRRDAGGRGSGGRDEGEASRRTVRFESPVPAWLVRLHGRNFTTASIALEGIGAGGAQLRATDMPGADERCWLVVDLEDGHADPVVVFGARVVWSLPEDHELGVVFSGSLHAGVDGLALVRAEVAGG